MRFLASYDDDPIIIDSFFDLMLILCFKLHVLNKKIKFNFNSTILSLGDEFFVMRRNPSRPFWGLDILSGDY